MKALVVCAVLIVAIAAQQDSRFGLISLCPHCLNNTNVVCTINSKGNLMTFMNPCYLGQYNCQNPRQPPYRIVSLGPCQCNCTSSTTTSTSTSTPTTTSSTSSSTTRVTPVAAVVTESSSTTTK